MGSDALSKSATLLNVDEMSIHFCVSETKNKKKQSETRKTPSCPLRKGLTGWKKQQMENYHTHKHRLKHWARKQEANNSRPMWRGTLALNHLANLKQPWGKGSGSSSSVPLCVNPGHTALSKAKWFTVIWTVRMLAKTFPFNSTNCCRGLCVSCQITSIATYVTDRLASLVS